MHLRRLSKNGYRLTKKGNNANEHRFECCFNLCLVGLVEVYVMNLWRLSKYGRRPSKKGNKLRKGGGGGAAGGLNGDRQPYTARKIMSSWHSHWDNDITSSYYLIGPSLRTNHTF